LLDAPAEHTVAGLGDRAILSVGLQVGLRRAEIAALTVGDLHQNRDYDSLRVSRKGGRRDPLAINPQTAACLRAYLEASGHAADIDGLDRAAASVSSDHEANRPLFARVTIGWSRLLFPVLLSVVMKPDWRAGLVPEIFDVARQFSRRPG
jgi:integrase